MDEKEVGEQRARTVSRRQFLKLASLAGLSVAAGYYGLDRLSSWNETPEVALIKEVDEARERCADFVRSNDKLSRRAHSIVKHPDLENSFWTDISFFPPSVDLMLFDVVREATVEAINESSGTDLVERVDEARSRAVHDKLLGSGARDLSQGFLPRDLISRWPVNTATFEDIDTYNDNSPPDRIENRYPMPVNIKIIDTSDSLDGYFAGDTIWAGVGTEAYVFGKKLEKEEAERLLGMIVCHELAHALDIIANPNLGKYFSKKELSRKYGDRLGVIDLTASLALPFVNSMQSLEQPLKSNDRNNMRVTLRSIWGDINNLSADQIRTQSGYYPREIWETILTYPDYINRGNISQRAVQIVKGEDKETIPDEILPRFAIDIGRIHLESLAELGGAYLYLLSEFEGEVDSDLLADLRQFKEIQYIDTMIQNLGGGLVSKISTLVTQRFVGKSDGKEINKIVSKLEHSVAKIKHNRLSELNVF
jgi:hypothetical protein